VSVRLLLLVVAPQGLAKEAREEGKKKRRGGVTERPVVFRILRGSRPRGRGGRGRKEEKGGESTERRFGGIVSSRSHICTRVGRFREKERREKRRKRKKKKKKKKRRGKGKEAIWYAKTPLPPP